MSHSTAYKESPLVLDRMTAEAAEDLATTLATATRSARYTLRGYRSRGLFLRAWEGVTGDGRRMAAAAGNDLAAAADAAANLALFAVNMGATTQASLNELADVATLLADRVDAHRSQVQAQLEALNERVNHIEDRFQKSLTVRDQLRHTHAAYEAGRLHPGASVLLQAIAYVAYVDRIVAQEPNADRVKERRYALDVACKMLKPSGLTRPLGLDDWYRLSVQGTQVSQAAIYAYILGDQTPEAIGLGHLLRERAVSDVSVDDARRAAAIAATGRGIYDSESFIQAVADSASHLPLSHASST